MKECYFTPTKNTTSATICANCGQEKSMHTIGVESQPSCLGAVIGCPSKLILENRTDLPMVDFLRLAQEVVSMGRISNYDKQYCYLTSFTIDGQEYHIVSDLNEKSDKLTFYKRPS